MKFGMKQEGNILKIVHFVMHEKTGIPNRKKNQIRAATK